MNLTRRRAFKIFSRALIFILLITVASAGFSDASGISYYEHSRVLYDLGLYTGVSKNYFEPDLESFVDRETAIVFLLRLVGKAEEVGDYYEYKVSNVLGEYSDGRTVSEWARKYVAYGIENNLYPGDLQGSIMPKRLIDGKTFSGILMNCMDYYLTGDQWTISTYINSYLGGMTANDAKYLNEKTITKNDMIAIVWESLDIRTNDYSSFLNMIIDKNKISSDRLSRLGFVRSGGRYHPPKFAVKAIEDKHDYASGYSMNDGSRFEGQNSGGVPNGFGRVAYADGSVYEGNVLNGRRHGEGKLTRSDGFVYTGGWVNDLMNGRATMTWANGDSYSGDVVDGSFQGKGTMTWESGNMYSGEWWAGNFHGQGKFLWSNGNYYDGQWNMGEFNGYGTLVTSNGELYEGYWKNGRRHGSGRCVCKDGTVKSGRWEEDVYIGE